MWSEIVAYIMEYAYGMKPRSTKKRRLNNESISFATMLHLGQSTSQSQVRRTLYYITEKPAVGSLR